MSALTDADPFDRLKAAILRGAAPLGADRANIELGTSYGIVEAEVVANDSRRPEVYVGLARRIILAAHLETRA